MPVFITGGGRDAVSINVSTTFPLAACGVFCAPDDNALYNLGTIDSGGYEGFTLNFTQPDSTNLATYTHWPIGIYGYRQSHTVVRNVSMMRPWNALKFDGFRGPIIENVLVSAFNHGLEPDSMIE